MPSTLQWANLVAFCVNIFFTYAGGIATLFGGKTNSQVSKEYTAIVTPAGWAFSIWSIIFIGEGIFTVWQLLPAQRESRVLKAIGYWWVIACGIQSAWTLAFAFEVMWLAALPPINRQHLRVSWVGGSVFSHSPSISVGCVL